VAEEVDVDIQSGLVLEFWGLVRTLAVHTAEHMDYVEPGELSKRDVLVFPRKDLDLVQGGRMELIVDAPVEVEKAALIVEELVKNIENVLAGEMIEVFVALAAAVDIAVTEGPQKLGRYIDLVSVHLMLRV
tara:strand:- start:865 stop:1257 length:393 start_codon:yes stop_codon:yes gene_type:complete